MAQALGDGFRMASALSLALILFGSNQLTAQQHRDDGVMMMNVSQPQTVSPLDQNLGVYGEQVHGTTVRSASIN